MTNTIDNWLDPYDECFIEICGITVKNERKESDYAFLGGDSW